MSKNNSIQTKSNFQDLPEIPIENKLTAAEVNQITGFQKSPVQKLTAFVDTDIIIDGTKEYSTTKVVTGATHTITASDDDAIANTLSSEHVQGNELRVRYQFDVDCTLTLVNFDTSGNNTGTITPIPAGTYDFKFKANARGVNLDIPQNTADGGALTDGSGTTANGNAVDLGGTQSGDVIIKKADGETFKVIRGDGTAGNWQELTLSEALTELHQLDTTNGWLGAYELSKLSFTNNIGGASIFARDEPVTKVAGLSCIADGTIMIGDLTNGSNRFVRMFFKHDYSSQWDALTAGQLARTIVDHGYNLEKFVNSTGTTNQTLASNLLHKKQVTVEGSEKTFSATLAVNFSTGTNGQEMPVEGNITSFTTSEEKSPGNYDVWLVNDATPGRTVAAPTGWTLIPGGDTHDDAANAVNLYQFKVSPSGLKRYIIKNM